MFTSKQRFGLLQALQVGTKAAAVVAVVALLAIAAAATSTSIMISPAAEPGINSVHMTDMLSTSCIDLCSCPSYCSWAPCPTVLLLSQAAQSSKFAIEQVAACAGCYHEPLCGNTWNVSLNDWCNYEVSASAASVHANVTLSKCSRLYQDEILVGVSIVMMVAMALGLILFYRNARRARASRVVAVATPQAYEPEPGIGPESPESPRTPPGSPPATEPLATEQALV